MPSLIGQSLGRYHIIEQLGEGGMAIVYKAYDTRLERDVAIKIIRQGAFPPDQVGRILKRFEREAKSLAKLFHPNIIKVLDYGEYKGSPYLVMEYMSGGTLKKYIGKPMPWQEAVRLLIPIANALNYAHENNIIHRDVKPANILLTGKNQPMLSDFGIAKILGVDEGHTLTGTGVGVGTPDYMAPEQGMGQKVDGRADIYSLGIIFYELVTGRKPYIADTPMAVALKHLTEPLPRPRQFIPTLPESVERVLIKTLSKNPQNRYPNAKALAATLEDLQSGKLAYITEQTADDSSKTMDVPLPTYGKPLQKRRAGLWTRLVIAGMVLIAGVILISTLNGGLAKGGVFFSTSTPSLTPPLPSTPTPSATHTPPATNTPLPTATIELGIGSKMTGKDGMPLLFIPVGEFIMGSNNGNPEEQPVHNVHLDAYWIDQAEVTNGMYAMCVQEGGCQPPSSTSSPTRGSYYGNPKYSNFPVIYVDWNKAQAYCLWANRRLPTEAEWEKAARGTDGRTYPWGNNAPNSALLNFDKNVGDSTEVGKYPAGASYYGALDMAGNVWEWVADWYASNYYANSPLSNPLGPSSGELRVIRGGSWNSDIYDTRSEFRDRGVPDVTFNRIGFRCASSAK